MKKSQLMLITFGLASLVPGLEGIFAWLVGSALLATGVIPIDLVLPFDFGFLLLTAAVTYAFSLLPALCSGVYFYTRIRNKKPVSAIKGYLIVLVGTLLVGSIIHFVAHVSTHGFSHMHFITKAIIEILRIIPFLTVSYFVLLLIGKHIVSKIVFNPSNNESA